MLRSLSCWFGRLASSGVALLGLVSASTVSAVTLRVHPDSAAVVGYPYFASILAANAVAAPGDSIEVSNAGSPYVHTVTLDLGSGVVYRGGFSTTFEGPNTVLYETVIQRETPVGVDATAVNAGTATLFSGFTVTGGNALFQAGGIFCPGGSTVEIRNCKITGNISAQSGGGIFVAQGAAPYIKNCDIERNVATTLRGGGIFVAQNAQATRIEFCRVLACSAATTGLTGGGGGGIFSASSISLVDCTIDSCWSGYRGGGLLTTNCDLHGSANKFDGNVAQSDGGAAYHQNGNGEHLRSFFDRCVSVAGNGGGLTFEGGTWLVSECYVRDCTAQAKGGGLYYASPVGAELRLTEVLGNTANRGGGIGIVGDTFRSVLSLQIESCTIALNRAVVGGEAGGGIHIFPEGNFADPILNCIVAEQAAGSCISTEGALNQPNIRFSCVWNDGANTSPPYGLSCADRTGINGNISFDPQFCNTAVSPAQVGLRGTSPCLEAGEGDIDMGAHPGWTGNCDLVSVEAASWGRLKALFR